MSNLRTHDTYQRLVDGLPIFSYGDVPRIIPGLCHCSSLKLTDEDAEGEIYRGVEDYGILDAVFEIFKARFKDDFNFVED